MIVNTLSFNTQMQMATSTLFPILFFLFFSSTLPLLIQSTTPKSQAFVFPIKKDDTTSQYYTSIRIGSSSTKFNVVIDLGGKFLWFNSIRYFRAVVASASYRPILCGSQQCSIVEDPGCTNCSSSSPVPGCTNNTCSDYALNPFSGTQGYSGLGLEVLHLYSTRANQYKVNNFPFQFSDPTLREGLSNLTAGVIGLGRTRISVQAQVASAFNIPQKFALCIPHSGNNGNLIIGQTSYKKPFSIISNSLFTTPLIRNPVSIWGNSAIGNLVSPEYFINVKSIKVGDASLVLNKTLLSIDKKTGDGGTVIRTVKAYTSLEKSIYTTLNNEFAKAAKNKGIKRVAHVAPFGACFDSKTITSSKKGLDVPIIDFVLQNNNVYWRFYGSNSMVRVGNDVVCLAFVEEELALVGPKISIVVGGYQMENYLLEFDVDSSKLGFSSSLLLHDTSCSNFGAA